MPKLLDELRNHREPETEEDQALWRREIDEPDRVDDLIDEIGLPTDADDVGREIIRTEYGTMVNTVKMLSFRVSNAKELSDTALLQQSEGQRVILARRILAMRRAWPWLLE